MTEEEEDFFVQLVVMTIEVCEKLNLVTVVVETSDFDQIQLYGNWCAVGPKMIEFLVSLQKKMTVLLTLVTVVIETSDSTQKQPYKD